jgi:hypothetical protein
MTTKSPGNDTLSGRSNECQTCYGTGEIVSDHGPESCHDCYGDGLSANHGNKMEWRLREIEKVFRATKNEGLPDVLFLLQELRQAREALVLILTRCQDADDTDEIAAYVRVRAREALRH